MSFHYNKKNMYESTNCYIVKRDTELEDTRCIKKGDNVPRSEDKVPNQEATSSERSQKPLKPRAPKNSTPTHFSKGQPHFRKGQPCCSRAVDESLPVFSTFLPLNKKQVLLCGYFFGSHYSRAGTKPLARLWANP